MTGQDGDPFRGRRWHWPSKRSIFEKNLLIQKHLKIAEKGTFFSFTRKKARKSAFFLPPESEICRHLRSSISTGYSTFFRFFCRSENPKISTFLRFPDIMIFAVRNQNFQKSALLRKVEILRFLLSGSDFWQVTYGSLQTAKNRTFSRFCDFCRFLRFLWFLQILQILQISGLSGKVRKVRFWTAQNSTFWCPKFRTFCNISDIVSISVIWWQTTCLDVCCYIFFWVFCWPKKLEKYISLASTTLVTAG